MGPDLHRSSHDNDQLCRWWNGEYDHGALFCHSEAEPGTEACTEHREDCQEQPCGETPRPGTVTCRIHERGPLVLVHDAPRHADVWAV